MKKEMIEKFLCPGCINGCDTECGMYQMSQFDLRCDNHVPGTIYNGYKIILGLPNGFSRGVDFVNLYESLEEMQKTFGPLNEFNIPVWAYEDNEYLFLRVALPRLGKFYIFIIKNAKAEDLIIECEIKPLVLSKEQINLMD